MYKQDLALNNLQWCDEEYAVFFSFSFSIFIEPNY